VASYGGVSRCLLVDDNAISGSPASLLEREGRWMVGAASAAPMRRKARSCIPMSSCVDIFSQRAITRGSNSRSGGLADGLARVPSS